MLNDLPTTSFSAPHGPFEGTTNPLMSMLGFLSAAVSPDIAASAAQAAMKSLLHAKNNSDNMNVETDDNTKEPNTDDLKIASTSALSAAVLKAQLLSLQEEREMEKLVIKLIELQMQKIQLKLSNFRTLEKLLDEEHKKVGNYLLMFC